VFILLEILKEEKQKAADEAAELQKIINESIQLATVNTLLKVSRP